MLDNRDAGGEQHRVRRPDPSGCVVDVERVDADERRSAIAKMESSLLRSIPDRVVR